MQKTKNTKTADIKRSWHLFDINSKILGRAASQIALLLTGKGKPYYVPHLDCGDHVVVINSDTLKVSGNKLKMKIYSRYSGYPSGLKKETLGDKLKSNSERVVYLAIFGMIADNKLRAKLMKRLYIFKNDNHPYKKYLSQKNG